MEKSASSTYVQKEDTKVNQKYCLSCQDKATILENSLKKLQKTNKKKSINELINDQNIINSIIDQIESKLKSNEPQICFEVFKNQPKRKDLLEIFNLQCKKYCFSQNNGDLSLKNCFDVIRNPIYEACLKKEEKSNFSQTASTSKIEMNDLNLLSSELNNDPQNQQFFEDKKDFSAPTKETLVFLYVEGSKIHKNKIDKLPELFQNELKLKDKPEFVELKKKPHGNYEKK